jgi:hypothetical protein
VRRKIGLLAILSTLTMSIFAMLGAVPEQEGGVPPQPFFADYFSGQVFIQGMPAPGGAQLVACVDDCSVFESQPVLLVPGGGFNLLEVNPENRRLRGRTIKFYLVNHYGRIEAAETAVFEGAYNISRLDLSFSESLPALASATALPPVGDPIIPAIPPIALGVGSAAALAGAFLLRATRRRAALTPGSGSPGLGGQHHHSHILGQVEGRYR